ncbi:hypothetical protein FJW05_19815 [Mesorhizobium sp. B2-9-1]|uniref:hypothetical protein n=1 Tax=unclassified Mesorhizobium TaxID=325217 RepID=UPI00112D222F|nr:MULTISPECIES: hypothetical protein [unclassified Mesorhizobium]TPI45003.1 hypothetical protein FJW05_19815 [Mesorhizobium sp. B2-9-1]TPJ30116.1 hypothetical protein FJ425_05110 [Mesorhizobium sp. B2-7-2]
MYLRFACALAGALVLCMPVAANARQPGDARLAGHYYLNGVMEVGSELLLKNDGSFEFALAYGANDQYGKGCWVRKGSTVEVIPAGHSSASTHHTPDDSGFSGLVLTVSGSSLVWDINGSGHKGRFEK